MLQKLNKIMIIMMMLMMEMKMREMMKKDGEMGTNVLVSVLKSTVLTF